MSNVRARRAAAEAVMVMSAFAKPMPTMLRAKASPACPPPQNFVADDDHIAGVDLAFQNAGAASLAFKNHAGPSKTKLGLEP